MEDPFRSGSSPKCVVPPAVGGSSSSPPDPLHETMWPHKVTMAGDRNVGEEAAAFVTGPPANRVERSP